MGSGRTNRPPQAATSGSEATISSAIGQDLCEGLGLDVDAQIVELGSHGNHLRAAIRELGVTTTIVEPDADLAARLGGTA